MRSILVMLIAIALLAVPALAFDISGYDFSSIEDEDQAMVSDSGTYTFNRVVVDDNGEFTGQNAYSGLIFGVDEEDEFTNSNGDLIEAETAGIVANKVKTEADGISSTITRQYLQQKGSAYVTLRDITDPENPPKITVDMGFTKSNLAWASGNLKSFTATPVSYAVVGGNGLNAVPEDLSPLCKNAWLYEQENEVPITVKATGSASLLEAYVGSQSKASLTMVPEGKTSDEAARMSGYAERFAGYTDAFVDDYLDYEKDPDDNKIIIDFGPVDGEDAATIEHYWTRENPIVLDEPTCDDFPNQIPVYDESEDKVVGYQELVTWPNNYPNSEDWPYEGVVDYGDPYNPDDDRIVIP
jgi:hypothetical protein